VFAYALRVLCDPGFAFAKHIQEAIWTSRSGEGLFPFQTESVQKAVSVSGLEKPGTGQGRKDAGSTLVGRGLRPPGKGAFFCVLGHLPHGPSLWPGAAVQAQHMDWLHLPIADYSVPCPAFETLWAMHGPGLRARHRAGAIETPQLAYVMALPPVPPQA